VASSVPVTVYTNTKGPAEILATLVRDLELDPPEYRKRIRQLLDENQQAFVTAAVEVMKTQPDARGVHFVTALLVSSGLILPALCDPSLSLEQALAMARVAMRADSTKDVVLGRASPDRVASSRVIRILEQKSGGRDHLSLLLRLLRQPNPYLRSKAVLMVARGTRNVNWVRKTLADADPRIRANAVEALWGLDTPDARDLLGSLRDDPNNRVAGNALLGLYQLGDTGVVPEIVRMAGHETPAFRSTAAWVMGAAGHPRFAEELSRLLKDPHTLPRRAALAALGRLHKAAAHAQTLRVRRLAAHFLSGGASLGQRRVALAVAAVPGAEASPVLPTQVILSEDGRAVHHYNLVQSDVAEVSPVVFLLPCSESGAPSSWSRYALACLNLKRPADAWSCLTYASGILQSGDATAEDGAPRFTADESAIREDFGKLPLLPSRTDVWHAIWRSVRPDGEGNSPRRHLIICNDSTSDRAPGVGLISDVLASGTPVQVVSSVSNPALEGLCRRVSGIFLHGRTPAALAALVEQAYLNLQVHYEITYQPVVARAKTLKILLCHPSGWGEASIPIPSLEPEEPPLINGSNPNRLPVE
jgi:HEAT repeats